MHFFSVDTALTRLLENLIWPGHFMRHDCYQPLSGRLWVPVNSERGARRAFLSTDVGTPPEAGPVVSAAFQGGGQGRFNAPGKQPLPGPLLPAGEESFKGHPGKGDCSLLHQLSGVKDG